jgi:hypothetical protein
MKSSARRLLFCASLCVSGWALAGSAPVTQLPVQVISGAKAGMAYADARALLLAGGWQPIVNPACRVKVDGAPCADLPEIDTCGSGGLCLMRFQNPVTHEALEVTTFGDINDWNVHGSLSQLFIQGLDKTPARH